MSSANMPRPTLIGRTGAEKSESAGLMCGSFRHELACEQTEMCAAGCDGHAGLLELVDLLTTARPILVRAEDVTQDLEVTAARCRPLLRLDDGGNHGPRRI